MGWVKEKGLYVECDQVGNILICKGVIVGMENCKLVVLQVYFDMVLQKNNDIVYDFVKDLIQLYIDGEWVKVCGIMLGVDNGIGMVFVLVVLVDDSVVYGLLEVLLIMIEEVGMDGVFGLQVNWLQVDILINIDFEEEGEIYMGCVGGIDFIFNLVLICEVIFVGFQSFKVILKGLKGGYFGGDIYFGLGNVNKLLLCFFVGYVDELDLCLVDFNGGMLCNVILCEVYVIVVVVVDKVDVLKVLVNIYQVLLKNELEVKEKNLVVFVEVVDNDKVVLIQVFCDIFICLLNVMLNGVICNFDVVKGVVEILLNVGVVIMIDDNVQIYCLICLLIDSGKDYVVSMLDFLGKLVGVKIEVKGVYSGW